MADIPYSDLIRVFGRIGLLSFGGPAAQISLMHQSLVDDRSWMTERQFLGALSFCMLLPGPEAMQLATYSGWRLRGIPGGLISGLLFVLPGALVILALALLYAYFGQVPVMQAVFQGIQATVVIIVLQALWRLSRKALIGPVAWALALAGFAAMYALAIPFPIVIALAALVGALALPGTADPAPTIAAPPLRQSLGIALIFAILWALPLLILWAFGAAFLSQIALFFSKLAIVTFGGAYAVLSYMTQEVVQRFDWLTTTEMIDALGLAETTPGPLILVTEFVGLLAGFKEGGLPLALAAGALTLWVTFIPCFLWVFAGAPYIETLLSRPRLTAALSGVSAAVVGVILNLSLWFALHVFFGTLRETPLGLAPVVNSFDPSAAALAALAAVLLIGRGLTILPVLSLTAAAAGLMSLAF